MMGESMYSIIKLKKLRLENKWSIKDISEKLNISAAYYCLIENKKRNLSYEMAIKIAQLFNLKPDELFLS